MRFLVFALLFRIAHFPFFSTCIASETGFGARTMLNVGSSFAFGELSSFCFSVCSNVKHWNVAECGSVVLKSFCLVRCYITRWSILSHFRLWYVASFEVMVLVKGWFEIRKLFLVDPIFSWCTRGANTPLKTESMLWMRSFSGALVSTTAVSSLKGPTAFAMNFGFCLFATLHESFTCPSSPYMITECQRRNCRIFEIVMPKLRS